MLPALLRIVGESGLSVARFIELLEDRQLLAATPTPVASHLVATGSAVIATQNNVSTLAINAQAAATASVGGLASASADVTPTTGVVTGATPGAVNLSATAAINGAQSTDLFSQQSASLAPASTSELIVTRGVGADPLVIGLGVTNSSNLFSDATIGAGASAAATGVSSSFVSLPNSD